MSQEFKNPFTVWQDLNKNMFEVWNDAVSQFVPETAEKPMNTMMEIYDGFLKQLNQNPFSQLQNPFASFQKTVYGSDVVKEISTMFTEGMQSWSQIIPNEPVRDAFNRMLNSYKLYSWVQPYWENFTKAMPFPVDSKNWDEFVKNSLEQFKSMTDMFAGAVMPEELNNMLSMTLDKIPMMQRFLVEFYKPWTEGAPELQKLFSKAIQGDKVAYLEFVKACSGMYKDSYSKVFNMQLAGANHATIEKLLKLFDEYINYLTKVHEYSVLISGMMGDTMEKFLKNLSELQLEGNPPETFGEFFKLWSSLNEQAFHQLYVTDVFSKLMNETVSAGSKFKIMYDDVMQDILYNILPLPNRREMDSVEKEVYELRKKVKEQEKELKKIKSTIENK